MCKLLAALKSFRGVGANCIYPLLGTSMFDDCRFAGSDVNQKSIDWAEENIIRKNKHILERWIDNGGKIRLQKDPSSIFEGVLYDTDRFDFSVCNPPFFSETEDRNTRYSSVCPI